MSQSSGSEDGAPDLSSVLNWLSDELDHIRKSAEDLQIAIAESSGALIDPGDLQSLDQMTQAADNLCRCAKTLSAHVDNSSVDPDPLLQVISLGAIKNRLAQKVGRSINADAQSTSNGGDIDFF